jgi:hypothetical protein
VSYGRADGRKQAPCELTLCSGLMPVAAVERKGRRRAFPAERINPLRKQSRSRACSPSIVTQPSKLCVADCCW